MMRIISSIAPSEKKADLIFSFPESEEKYFLFVEEKEMKIYKGTDISKISTYPF